MKHDRKWMEQTLPLTKIGQDYVNWESVDKELSEKIIEALKQVYASNPSKRVQKSILISCLSETDKNRVRNHRYKLPLTVNTLKNCEENKEAFQVRKSIKE